MEEFLNAIANHPWVSIFLALFIMIVLDEIIDMFKAAIGLLDEIIDIINISRRVIRNYTLLICFYYR